VATKVFDNVGFMVTVTAEITIRATPQQVWDVLATFDEYHLWNPSIVEAAGIAEPRRRLRFAMRRGNGVIRLRPTVTAVVPACILEWQSRFVVLGLLDRRHRFDLEPVNDGTRVIQSECFRGVFVHMMPDLHVETAASFDESNAALRERVEAASAQV